MAEAEKHRPSWPALLGPMAIGGVVAVAWVAIAGGDELLAAARSVRWIGVVGMVGITAAWFFLRFLRSQFLLRRAGIRIPIRPALASYLAALPGTATPAYVGEAIRSVFLRRRFGVPLRATLPVLLLERLYDVAALALIAAAFGGWAGWRLGGGFGLAALVVAALMWPLFRRLGMPPGALARLRKPWTVVTGLGASLCAWLVAALLYPLGGWSLGASVGVADGVLTFARSTLLGALTLLPAGAGATGSLAILDLTGHGLSVAAAVSLVTLVRSASVGVAMVAGAGFLWREVRGAPPRSPELVAHFDTIADEYAEQWSPHVWDLLLERKLALMAAALPSPPASAGIGIDLGCGLGLQAAAMRRRGYHVFGVEPSIGLLRSRPTRSTPMIAGDALRLPFPDGSIDFVYVVGVLHHLPDRRAQDQAIVEVCRVLRPGGVLLVHESNPRNPFFRFYMGYLFPILKSIDEGTEWWIDPRRWEAVPGLRLERTRYFTFVPDFIPRFLLRPAMALERWLERGPTAPWSAHYLVSLRRGQP